MFHAILCKSKIIPLLLSYITLVYVQEFLRGTVTLYATTCVTIYVTVHVTDCV